MKRFLYAVVALITLTSCQKDYEDRLAELKEHVSDPIGGGKDFWIIKHSQFGFSEPIGLIFGFVSDEDGCEEFVSAYQKHYQGKYSCEPAN